MPSRHSLLIRAPPEFKDFIRKYRIMLELKTGKDWNDVQAMKRLAERLTRDLKDGWKWIESDGM